MIVKIPVTARRHPGDRGGHVSRRSASTPPSRSRCRSAIAVAEAVERGLDAREAEGKDIATMGPVCTIMVAAWTTGSRSSWTSEDISVDPGFLEWAGVAVFKKTYRLFRERGYRIRLLSAAFRNHMHWSEFIGGDVVISPPCIVAEALQRQRRRGKNRGSIRPWSRDRRRPAEALPSISARGLDGRWTHDAEFDFVSGRRCELTAVHRSIYRFGRADHAEILMPARTGVMQPSEAFILQCQFKGC